MGEAPSRSQPRGVGREVVLGSPVEGGGGCSGSGRLLIYFPFYIDGFVSQSHWAVSEGASFGGNHRVT